MSGPTLRASHLRRPPALGIAAFMLWTAQRAARAALEARDDTTALHHVNTLHRIEDVATTPSLRRAAASTVRSVINQVSARESRVCPFPARRGLPGAHPEDRPPDRPPPCAA